MEVIGRVLGGRYRIVRSIGAGGMGGVYEAIQEGLGRRVAVKVIAQDLAEEPLYLERFEREAMTTAQLGHPNLVTVTDFGRTPGEPPFFVMELLEGEPLHQRLSRGALEPSLAVEITLQILAGLEAAHARGIVHRDLKPANVFLVPLPAGRVLVKILDFGIAKLMDSAVFSRLTQTGVLIGTPRYAAPEQIRDSKSVDVRTDVYATGTLLYCMLTGRPPHTSAGAQLLVDIQDREPTDPGILVPRLSPALVAVVRRAMQKDPARRFASARELAEALARCAGAAASAAGPPQPLATTAPIDRGRAQPPPDDPSTRPGRLAAPERATRPSRPGAGGPTPHTPIGGYAAPGHVAPPTPVAAYGPSSSTPPTQTPTPSPLGAPFATESRRPPAPTMPLRGPSAPPPPARSRGVLAGVAVGVGLGGLLVVGGVVGLALYLHGHRTSHGPLDPRPAPDDDAPPAPARDVSEACREWHRATCECPDPEIVRGYCAYSRNVIDSMERGEVGEWDCVAMRDQFRSLCASGAAPSDRAPGSAVPRPPTGLAACDELTHVACTCGPPTEERDMRCHSANAFVTTEIPNHGERGCRVELANVRRRCAGP
ncbi:MAG: protein kinase [Sandaracinaceae bacterium]|nr:protein kinase [Sandaracinaceae bacterium]